MKLTVIIGNIALFGFTCLVLLTDGLPREALYIFLTLLVLLVSALNLLVIFNNGKESKWLIMLMKNKVTDKQTKVDNLSSNYPVLKITVIICNLILFILSCWAYLTQYPHPKEEGFILYTVLLLLTPVLSSFAVFYRGTKKNMHAEYK